MTIKLRVSLQLASLVYIDCHSVLYWSVSMQWQLVALKCIIQLKYATVYIWHSQVTPCAGTVPEPRSGSGYVVQYSWYWTGIVLYTVMHAYACSGEGSALLGIHLVGNWVWFIVLVVNVFVRACTALALSIPSIIPILSDGSTTIIVSFNSLQYLLSASSYT